MNIVQVTIENNVAFLTLNRPEKYNSVNREMALALQQALDDCERNAYVRCIYLTGAGKGFCSGQDLGEFPEPTKINFDQVVNEHYNPIILRLRNIEKPIIAAVNGVAAGAGANLALACDVVVAKKSATFIQAFSKIGLIPDSGGTFFLPRLIGLQRAGALMMLADKITADEASAMGMIYKAMPDEDFEKESKLIANTLAQMPTVGLGLTKRALNQSSINNLEQQLELEKELQARAGMTEDFREGINAFLEKRTPKFNGH